MVPARVKSVRPDSSGASSAMQLFDEAPQETFGRPALSLVAVLYYYAAHYSAVLYHAKRRIWVCVDDSYVREVKWIFDWQITVNILYIAGIVHVRNRILKFGWDRFRPLSFFAAFLSFVSPLFIPFSDSRPSLSTYRESVVVVKAPPVGPVEPGRQAHFWRI